MRASKAKQKKTPSTPASRSGFPATSMPRLFTLLARPRPDPSSNERIHSCVIRRGIFGVSLSSGVWPPLRLREDATAYLLTTDDNPSGSFRRARQKGPCAGIKPPEVKSHPNLLSNKEGLHFRHELSSYHAFLPPPLPHNLSLGSHHATCSGALAKRAGALDPPSAPPHYLRRSHV